MPTPTFRRSAACGFATLLTTAALIGCSSNSSNNSDPAPAGLSLRQGPAPIAYMVAQGGKISVRDTTASKTVARATVAPSTPVTIDPTVGITIGSKVVTKGPLPPDHRYEIILDKSP